MLNNETIGVWLKALREGNSLTVSGLARELGCGRGSIIRWERDRCMLDTDHLVAYMKRFNVSADYILTGEEKLHPDTEKLDKAYGDGYKTGYLQAKNDCLNAVIDALQI